MGVRNCNEEKGGYILHPVNANPAAFRKKAMKQLILFTLTLLFVTGSGGAPAAPAAEAPTFHRETEGDKLNPMIHKLPSAHGHGGEQKPALPKAKVSFYDESITADLPPVEAGTTATSDILTITGVKQGDFCLVSSSGLLPTGIALTCRTLFEGAVVYLHNVSTTLQDPPEQTYYVRIFKR